MSSFYTGKYTCRLWTGKKEVDKEVELKVAARTTTAVGWLEAHCTNRGRRRDGQHSSMIFKKICLAPVLYGGAIFKQR